MAGVVMKGLPQLKRLAKAAAPEAHRDLTKGLRGVAEPIRADAESLAATSIRRVGPRWSRMRVGVTQRLVYVAPRQKGVRARGPHPKRRPKFATLLEQRAMTPALERNEGRIEAAANQALAEFSAKWNRIG
jgi:hypothetical protein